MNEEELKEDLKDIISYLEGELVSTAIRNLKSLLADIERFGVD